MTAYVCAYDYMYNGPIRQHGSRNAEQSRGTHGHTRTLSVMGRPIHLLHLSIYAGTLPFCISIAFHGHTTWSAAALFSQTPNLCLSMLVGCCCFDLHPGPVCSWRSGGVTWSLPLLCCAGRHFCSHYAPLLQAYDLTCIHTHKAGVAI